MITDAPEAPDDQAGKRKPRVLILSSDAPDSRALGGIAVHAAALARNAAANAEVFTVHPSGGALHVERWKPRRLLATLPLPSPPRGVDGTPSLTRALTAALAGTSADVLHVHSPLLGPSSIAEAARRAGARLTITLHDHSLVCENYTLLEGGERHCGIPADLRRCDACLAHVLGRPLLPEGDVIRHRDRVKPLVARTDVFVAPSRSVLELCARVHPDVPSKARYVEWGAPETRLVPFRSATEPGPLRVAFVGLLSKKKGRERLAPLFHACRDLDVEWHVFGATLGESLRDVQQSAPRVVLHGAYRREDISRRLAVAGCHVAILPSLFAESFSMALSDVLGAGLPVIASDLGALRERVLADPSGQLGWTFDPWEPETLARVVSELCANRTLVDDAATRVRSRAVRTDADMARDHVAIWSELAAARPAPDRRALTGALGDFRGAEQLAHRSGRSVLGRMVKRLRGSLFYQDLPLRRLVSEPRRKAVERAVTALFTRNKK